MLRLLVDVHELSAQHLRASGEIRKAIVDRGLVVLVYAKPPDGELSPAVVSLSLRLGLPYFPVQTQSE